MVSDRVDIITKSYQDEPAVKWTSTGDTTYEMEETEKASRGTDIVLHLSEDAQEYLEDQTVEQILNRFCKFLPVPIQFGTEEYTETVEPKKEGEEAETITKTRDKIINNTDPIWTKAPADLKDEDYLAFYNELYPFEEPPLFWIHLNVDYPFNLTGVLYFPKFKNTYEVQKNKIQLYSNQVFVTDQVEEIVPDYLMLLQGVIDSPDIPLNVSRSYLQGDPNVKKINNHISKKVADKLQELFKNDREAYNSKWEDINVFVKYGMISDEKFYDRAHEIALYKSTTGDLHNLDEYKAKYAANQTDKDDNLVVLYTTHEKDQHTYIQTARNKGYDVIVLDSVIDSHFINTMEQKAEKVQFKRVDADTIDKLIEKEENLESVLSEEDQEKLKNIFEERVDQQKVTIQLKALSPEDMPVYITRPEFMRRMQDMSQASGQSPFGDNMPEFLNLVVNTNHPLAEKVLRSKGRKDQLVKQLYDLALLSQNMLTGEDLTQFISRSVDVLEN
jgi:molecular chaperone HtpG